MNSYEVHRREDLFFWKVVVRDCTMDQAMLYVKHGLTKAIYF